MQSSVTFDPSKNKTFLILLTVLKKLDINKIQVYGSPDIPNWTVLIVSVTVHLLVITCCPPASLCSRFKITQAQCCLPVQPAGLVDSGGQRQTRVRHTGVLLRMLSQGVTQIPGEGQSEGTECEDRSSSTGQDLHTLWLLTCCG